MKALFADTFYFLALLNARDEAHAAAEAFTASRSVKLVTTAWVMTELADGLATTAGRSMFAAVLRELESDRQTRVVAADHTLWQRGVHLYERRPDKGWSLTDCISFVVMEDEGIADALTADHHFEQAGFRALLKPKS